MPPFRTLAVPDLLLDEMIEHAFAESPVECCGLLAGHARDGVGVVTARFAIANELGSPTEYRTDARDLFRAFRAMREGGLELMAIYHSHPLSAPVPSRRDLDQNTYGESVAHVIIGLFPEPAVRVWWLGESDYRAVTLDVTSPGL
ncbi:MAG: M67 family metallopeptidase [Gemmataceae bacterium]|nr:M67 family metallopeptidase [Gemmataceae bacterium]